MVSELPPWTFRVLCISCGGIGMLPITVAAINTLAIPIVGVYSSALLLDEQIGMREGVALALVVSAPAVVLALPSISSVLKRDSH